MKITGTFKNIQTSKYRRLKKDLEANQRFICHLTVIDLTKYLEILSVSLIYYD